MTVKSRHARLVVGAGLLGVLLVGAPAAAAPGGTGWDTAGGDRTNSRDAANESKISPSSVGRLVVKWQVTTGGDVSATPAVDDRRVYFPDWAGNLYAVDRTTGAVVWQRKISDYTGVAGDKARATPAVTDTSLIIGNQGPLGHGGAVMAVDKATGALRWVTQVDSHPAAIITQSATVFNGVAYVGVASQEELLASGIAGPYACCSFRGSFAALDVTTGALLWRTVLTPAGYPGVAVWGSSPAIDAKRGSVYVATGNNYDVPDAVLACVQAAGGDPAAQRACIAPDDFFDSILSLDLKTGRVRWATHALPFDAWTVSCIFGDPSNCPSPSGPDFDFGQAPAIFKIASGPQKGRELVGAGQKSGQYWALDPDSGAVVWTTQAGPGGTAGGLQWGSAVDGHRVYTANANSNLVPYAGSTDGVWSALDAATGQVQWQTRPHHGGSTSGPVTTANGVVFGCSLDPEGWMYALDAATGARLWEFRSGGGCLSGAAISNGTVFWGSGYSNFGFSTPNNRLYAFGLS